MLEIAGNSKCDYEYLSKIADSVTLPAVSLLVLFPSLYTYSSILHLVIHRIHSYTDPHPSNPTHKLLNPLKHPLRTRPRRTNMRLKPKLLTQMIPRRRPNSSNKHLSIPIPRSIPSKRPQPKNPKHSLTPRRRKNNHPNRPIRRPAHHIREIPLKRPHHARLIHNNLLNPNALLHRQCLIHQRLRDDIPAHFADQE